MTNQKKFYQTEWFMWFTLICFAPIGVPLLWKHNKCSKNTRIIFSVLSLVFFVIAVLTPSETPAPAPTPPPQYNCDSSTPAQTGKPKEPPKPVKPIDPEQAEKAKYNKWVDNQFSGWDGSHTTLKKIIVQSLNDEKSYKNIETRCRAIETEQDKEEINKFLQSQGYKEQVELKDLFVTQAFSAKNAFGGTIKHFAVAIVKYKTKKVKLINIIS